LRCSSPACSMRGPGRVAGGWHAAARVAGGRQQSSSWQTTSSMCVATEAEMRGGCTVIGTRRLGPMGLAAAALDKRGRLPGASGLDRRSAMPKHQAPRSWAKTKVTELPARARWAPSSSCRNSEARREAGAASASGYNTPRRATVALPRVSPLASVVFKLEHCLGAPSFNAPRISHSALLPSIPTSTGSRTHTALPPSAATEHPKETPQQLAWAGSGPGRGKAPARGRQNAAKQRALVEHVPGCTVGGQDTPPLLMQTTPNSKAMQYSDCPPTQSLLLGAHAGPTLSWRAL
jgi:hypothetical protein